MEAAMRRTRILSIVAAISLLAGLPVAAGDRNSPATTTTSAPAPAPQQEDASAPPAGCVRETGSRIKPAKGACGTAAGRVHDAGQLESTGALSAGDALRRLDPMLSGSPGH
ncbi:MAG: hypothetical protein ACT6T0_11305 [Nevskia sp.]|uniref:hypothetical protein n=1 Tax=Nevskia sp. TaxID=1929292 RepID=UPI00403676D0